MSCESGILYLDAALNEMKPPRLFNEEKKATNRHREGKGGGETDEKKRSRKL